MSRPTPNHVATPRVPSTVLAHRRVPMPATSESSTRLLIWRVDEPIEFVVCLAPVWTGALRRYRGAAAVVVLGVLALASAALRSGAKQTTNSIGSSTLQINSLVLLAGGGHRHPPVGQD